MVALLYLIGPGSLLALSAFVLALQRLPTSTVSTYAYVNPVVAVLLGALLLNEVITSRIVLAQPWSCSRPPRALVPRASGSLAT